MPSAIAFFSITFSNGTYDTVAFEFLTLDEGFNETELLKSTERFDRSRLFILDEKFK
jgi:hypothetical protein